MCIVNFNGLCIQACVMSRVKRSSGKEYRRLSQAAESDDEVILYSLSPSSQPSVQLRISTTEFGSGRYDQSLDLELPEIRKLPLNRGSASRRKGRLSVVRNLRSSKEARTCVCFLLLFAIAIGIVILVSFKLGVYWTPATSEQQSSTLPVATPTTQPPSNRPTGEASNTPTEEPPEENTSKNPPEEITIKPSEELPKEENTKEPPEEITTEPPENPEEISVGPPEEHTETTHLPPEEHTVVTPTTANEMDNGGSNGSEPVTPGTASIPPANLTAATTTEYLTPSSHPSPSPPPLPDPHHDSEDSETSRVKWEREFFPALTETTLQLQDMNYDNVTDVLMVEGQGSCDMILRALDGLTGQTVWEVPVHIPYDAFAVKCDVDLNKDDIIDCIAAGRQSGFKAISGADGSTLWDRDPNMAYLRYNFYFPLIVPDLDNDGVPDLINTHGGDSTYSESQKERSPSFLVIVSGRTGQQLMERVPVPDGHETYMSPVYLSRGEGVDDLLLLGTGGETLPGSLWAIGYDSLRTRVLSYCASGRYDPDYPPFTGYVNHACIEDMSQKEMEEQRPVFDSRSFDESHDTKHDKHLHFCHPWGSHNPVWNKYGLCVYHILTTTEKGVILPPVIAEMTGDSQDDLVVSTFDGKTLVINGESGDVVWEVTRPGTESYR